MNNFIIRIIFILCYQIFINYGLRWSKSGFPVNYKTVHLKTATSNFNVDLYYSTQITIVRDIQLWNHTMTIYCFITGFNFKSEISYSFCKNNDPCFNFKDKQGTLPFKEFNLKGFIETTFVDKRGFTVNVQVPNKYEDISGNYFCKADNDKIIIQSNYVQIRDTFFWERKIFTKVESNYKTSIKPLTMSNIPAVFNCSDGNSFLNTQMPVWAKSQFPSPVLWSVCPVLKNFNQLTAVQRMSADKCLSYTSSVCDSRIDPRICPRELSKMSGWKYYVNERGDLILRDLPFENTNTGDTYLLMCYTKNVDDELQAISYFLDTKNDANIESGITIIGAKQSFTQKLEAISPSVQHVIIYARQGPSDLALEAVAIYGLYRSSSDSTFQWRFNSVQMNSNNIWTVTKYMVTFENEITFDLAGKYSLQVVDKSQKLTLGIQVQIQGLPVLVNDTCLPAYIYAWTNDNIVIRCEYRLRPSEFKLLINSQEIQLNDSLTTSQAQLKSSHPNLSDLTFNMTPSAFVESDSVVITYSAFNLRNHDHSVTFTASNIFGMSLKSTSIYVLPHLRSVIRHFPDKDNCTVACTNTRSHIFRCDIGSGEYFNKELIVDHFWTLNNERLGGTHKTFGQYFQVDKITKELTLMPILSSSPFDMFVRALLNDTWVECHVNIRSHNSGNASFVYLSSTDTTISTRMKARIILDTANISQAKNHWIIGIILGIVVAASIIVLTVYCCKNRKTRQSPRAKYARSKQKGGEARDSEKIMLS